MTREIRSRRAGTAAGRRRPLYARVLGLQYINPSGLMCFVYFEGMIAFAVLLALAEQVTWWAVLVLPAVVALAVKVNDVVAGALVRSGGAARGATRRVVGRAAVPAQVALAPADRLDRGRAGESRPDDTAEDRSGVPQPDDADTPVVRAARQSAARRYG